MGPSPPKRLKLSPRVSTVSPNRSLADSQLIHSKMLTPIVKRKTSLEHRQTPDDKYRLNVCTPQSILKVQIHSHVFKSLSLCIFQSIYGLFPYITYTGHCSKHIFFTMHVHIRCSLIHSKTVIAKDAFKQKKAN